MPLHPRLRLFKINIPSNDVTMYSLCFQHSGEFRQNESSEEMLRPVVYRQLCEQPLRNQNIENCLMSALLSTSFSHAKANLKRPNYTEGVYSISMVF